MSETPSPASWEVRAWSSHAKTTVGFYNPECVTRFEVIAECSGSGQTDIAECERRALLIAAAEDMRDALVALVEAPLRYSGASIEIDCADHADAMERVRKARAALAKANGDSA